MAPTTTYRHRSGQVGRPSVIWEGYDEVRGKWNDGAPAKRVTDAIRAGNHVAAAAGWAGLGRSVVYQWLARGRESRPGGEYEREDVDPDERPYVDFLTAMQDAESLAEVELVTLVRAAARENWTAAMTMLARRFPHWRETTTLEVDQRSADDETLAALQQSPALVAKLAELAHELEDRRHDNVVVDAVARDSPALPAGDLVDLDDDSPIELED